MEGHSKRSHNVIRILGHCFFCLEKAVPTIAPARLDPDTDDDGQNSESDIFQPVAAFYPTYSLQYLSHYLKLDWGNLLVSKVGPTGFKVILCERCARLNGKFSELYQKLERIQMEIGSCLTDINGELTKAEVKGRSLDAVLNRKETEILAAARNETIQKCLNKLACKQPKIRMKRLASKDTKGDQNAKVAKAIKMRLRSSKSNVGRPSENGSRPLDPLLALQKSELTTAPPSPASIIGVEGSANIGLVPSRMEAEPGMIQSGISRLSMEINSEDKFSELLKVGEMGSSQSPTLNEETDRFVCKTCGEGFKCKCSVKHHFKSVHRQRYPSNCKFYIKEFGKKESREQEINLHNWNRNIGTVATFTCGRCGKSFTDKQMMKIHQYTFCPGRTKEGFGLHRTETEGGEQIDTFFDNLLQNRMLSSLPAPMPSGITSLTPGEKQFISFQPNYENETFSTSALALHKPNSAAALQKKTLPSSPVKPVTTPDEETSSCVKNRCKFAKVLKGEGVWIGCSWTHQKTRQPCKYWVHAKCFGYPDATMDEVDNMPAFYCPTHLSFK